MQSHLANELLITLQLDRHIFLVAIRHLDLVSMDEDVPTDILLCGRIGHGTLPLGL